ncbi:MAG: signal peptidase II [Acidobacteriota bacterium]
MSTENTPSGTTQTDEGGLLARAARRWRQGLLVIGVLALDQLTKAWIVSELALYQRREVIPGLFDLTYLVNTGGVWGLGQGLSQTMRQVIFLGLPVLVTLFAAWHALQLPYRDRLRQWSLALVVGGAMGNLTDRFRLGEVVDFLLFYRQDWSWPAFNIADSCICTGIGGLLLSSFLLTEDADEASPVLDEEPPPSSSPPDEPSETAAPTTP